MTIGEIVIMCVIAWLFYAIWSEGKNAEKRHHELSIQLTQQTARLARALETIELRLAP